MKETKYAYASEDPHESPSFFAFGSHGLPLRHASIMFGHDSPVAHLEYFRTREALQKGSNLIEMVEKFSKTFIVSMKNIITSYFLFSKLSFNTYKRTRYELI